jgi:hypothetical protein
VLGVASGAAGGVPEQWSAYRSVCLGSCDTVKCPLAPAVADDGTTDTPKGDKVQIACVNSVCTTSFAP